MNINVTITRSNEWVKAQRLATGDNVPNEVVVSVDPAGLSVDVRKRLIDWMGSYGDIKKLPFDNTFNPNQYANYGTIPFVVNEMIPSREQIDAAIATAFSELDQKRAEYLAAKQEREEQQAAEKAEKAEKAQRLTEARTLLADEIGKLTAERDKLSQQRDELSAFLVAIPLDALRGTVKRLVSGESEIAERINLIEDASSEWIFSNRDDE